MITQWAELKVVLIALVRTLLDEPGYIFTDSWMVIFPLGKLQTDRFKTLFFETMSSRYKSWMFIESFELLM